MKKILYVASSYGHIRSFHIPYIEKLQEMGFEVHVAAAAAPEQIGKQKMPQGESSHTEPSDNLKINKDIRLDDTVKINIPFKKKMLSPKNLVCTAQLVKLLKRENYDIISVHTSLAAFFVRLAVMLIIGQRPTVINTVHGYLFDENTLFTKRNILLCAEKLTKPATDVLVVMNNQDYRIAQKYQLYKENLIKIPGVGIDITRFSREKVEEEFFRNEDNQHFAMNNAIKNNTGTSNKKNIKEKVNQELWNSERAKLGISSEDIVLIYAAEFSKRKNQKMLIEAMAKLPTNVKLLLAGKGEQLKECKKLAERLGLNKERINEENLNENNEHSQSKFSQDAEAERVIFLGHVKKLEYYYYLSDICVSSSRSEGLPFNVMEAMSMGLPIIATNVKGHQDLIEPLKNGYLYDYDDIDDFVEGVMQLMPRQKNIDIYQNNIQKSKKYGLDNVMDEVLKIYKELML